MHYLRGLKYEVVNFCWKLICKNDKIQASNPRLIFLDPRVDIPQVRDG